MLVGRCQRREQPAEPAPLVEVLVEHRPPRAERQAALGHTNAADAFTADAAHFDRLARSHEQAARQDVAA